MNTNSLQHTFDALRPRLFGIAYRMLGSRADAEDILQDAWLRWRDTDHAVLRSTEAWLVAVVTRLAIDRLRAAKAERLAYVGEWLPEPIVGWHDESPEAIVERSNELSLAFMHMLERLGPEERAAFLLRQAFDYDYDEIAAMLGKSVVATRQVIHRARERLQLDRMRFDVSLEQHRRLLERFLAAANSGDRAAIRALLNDDAEAIGDGGGKVPSQVFRGADQIAKLYWAFYLKMGARVQYRLSMVNGEHGILRLVDGTLESTMAVATDGERISTIYVVRNPDKLARIASVSHPLDL
ncbi:MAG: RNA polymerase sigma-70 factor [Telluria sp.]